MKKNKKRSATAKLPPGAKLPRSVKRLFPQVTDVVDAKRNVKVIVTARDSENGKRLKASECAMAVAAKRDYEADGVVIGLSRAYIVKGNVATRFFVPSSVAREITSFDRHHDFAPGEYHLSSPAPTGRLGTYEGGKTRGDRKAKRIVRVRETARVRVLEHGVEK